MPRTTAPASAAAVPATSNDSDGGNCPSDLLPELRSDHAGETGAVWIYAASCARAPTPMCAPLRAATSPSTRPP